MVVSNQPEVGSNGFILKKFPYKIIFDTEEDSNHSLSTPYHEYWDAINLSQLQAKEDP